MTVPTLEQIEMLTERTDWVRALAGQLVADSHLADDVAQDAAVAALERPGETEGGRAWMAGVVRNVAANLRRRKGRRDQVEAQGAPAGAQPSAAEAAALVEQQRLLADAVLALEAPFRDVVLLRFYEGQPQREIARQLGVPVATVNSRLTRALAKLRVRLDHVHRGDRTAWVAALAPITIPTAARDLTWGAVIMKKKTATAALLAVLTASMGWFAMGDGRDDQPPEVAGSPMVAEPRNVAPVEAAAPEQDATAPAVERVKVETPAPVVPADGLIVRVVDGANGEPVPLAEVRLLDRTRQESKAMVEARRQVQLGRRDPFASIFVAGRPLPVDASGCCVVPVAKKPAILVAREGGRMGMLQLRSTRPAEDPMTLRLWSVQSARVRVVDGQGKPIVGALVGLRCKQNGQPVPVAKRVTEGPGGIAQVSWFRGALGLDAFGAEKPLQPEVFLAHPMAGDVHHALAEESDEPQDVTLTCPDVGTVEVAVTALGGPPPDGTLVHLVDVVDEQDVRGSMRMLLDRVSAETVEGVATFWPVGLGTKLQASAQLQPGVRSFEVVGEGPQKPGETVVLRLASSKSVVVLTGRVLDQQRKPVANAQLVMRRVEAAKPDSTSVETDAEGRFERQLAIDHRRAPGARMELVAYQPAERRVEFRLPRVGPGNRIDVGDLVMPTVAALVGGVVVDEAGKPVQGVQVQLVRKAEHYPTGWRGVTASLAPTTDAEGKFAIDSSTGEWPTGDLWLRVEPSGMLRHEPVPVAPRASQVRLVMRSAGILEGRIRVAGAVPVGQLSVWIWPESHGAPARGPTGWKHALIGRSGRVRVEGLTPDSYTVVVKMGWSNELARIAGVAVLAGKKNTDPRLSPVDLADVVRAVELRVTDGDGKRLNASIYALTDSTTHQLGSSLRPLLVPTSADMRTLVVECAGYFPADIGLVDASREVVLSRGLPVNVRVTDAPKLEKPYSLRIALEPLVPRVLGPGGRRAASFRADWQPDHAKVPDNGSVALRVREPGDYRVRVFVDRNDNGYVDQRDATPDSTPNVRVVEGIPGSLTVAIDAEQVQRQVKAMTDAWATRRK